MSIVAKPRCSESETVCSTFGFVERASGCNADEPAVAAQLEAGEGQYLVGRRAQALVGVARPEEAVGGQGELDELCDAVTSTVACLDALEGIAKTAPLRADVRRREAGLAEQSVELGAGCAVAQDTSEMLELTRGKGC
ncbi:MAG: hypothetical protein ACYCU0_03950 [Solirubrobacteraceae bacterium]